MKGIDISFALHPTPPPSAQWLEHSEGERMARINESLNQFKPDWNDTLELLSARNDGFLTFGFKRSIPVTMRGSYLLELEAHLKSTVDSCITLWLAPVGDKSSLRNLRGIEVKK